MEMEENDGEKIRRCNMQMSKTLQYANKLSAHLLEQVQAPAPRPSNNYAKTAGAATVMRKLRILQEVDGGLEGCGNTDSLCKVKIL